MIETDGLSSILVCIDRPVFELQLSFIFIQVIKSIK